MIEKSLFCVIIIGFAIGFIIPSMITDDGVMIKNVSIESDAITTAAGGGSGPIIGDSIGNLSLLNAKRLSEDSVGIMKISDAFIYNITGVSASCNSEQHSLSLSIAPEILKADSTVTAILNSNLTTESQVDLMSYVGTPGNVVNEQLKKLQG